MANSVDPNASLYGTLTPGSPLQFYNVGCMWQASLGGTGTQCIITIGSGAGTRYISRRSFDNQFCEYNPALGYELGLGVFADGSKKFNISVGRQAGAGGTADLTITIFEVGGSTTPLYDGIIVNVPGTDYYANDIYISHNGGGGDVCSGPACSFRVHNSGLTLAQKLAESLSVAAVIAAYANYRWDSYLTTGVDSSGNARHYTPVGTGVDSAVAFYTAPSGQTLPVGRSDETDSNFALGRTKRKLTGLATEADTALAVARSKRRLAGLATETDSAFAVAKSKRRLAGLATEADTALAVVRSKIKLTGLTTETDTALALGKSKQRLVGLATEADTALALARSKRRAAGRSDEIDTALSPYVPPTGQTLPVGRSDEVDTALALGKSKRRPVGLSIEVDTALARGWFRRLTIEVDTALALGKSKRRAPGLATETDAALAPAKRKQRLTGLATETDVAIDLARSKRRSHAVGFETDAALALVRIQQRATGLATETDTALARGRRKEQLIGRSDEIDTALSPVIVVDVINTPGSRTLFDAVESRATYERVESRTIFQ